MQPAERIAKIDSSIEAAQRISYALRDAALQLSQPNRDIIAAMLLRIGKCNEKTNWWFAREAWSEVTGEVFDAFGKYWRCNSKLCPSCIAHHAQRNRKKLTTAFDRQVLYTGQYYYFVTLTIPNPGKSLRVTRSIVNDAWSRFRKRKLWLDLVAGGVKAEEFTVTRNGVHYHLHLIIKSGYLKYNSVRRVWSECADAAFEKHGINYSINTVDGMAIVNIQRLRDRSKGIAEVCKYVTKSDSFTTMKGADLLDYALTERIPRMFELFGCFKLAADGSPILDTKHISDGESSEPKEQWRDKVRRLGFHAYIDALEAEILNAKRVRSEQLQYRWPNVTVVTLAEIDARAG